MKILRQITLCFALVFFVSVDAFAFQVRPRTHYIPIDALTMENVDNSRLISLDLKTRELDVLIENEIVTLFQAHDKTDNFARPFLIGDFGDWMITLEIVEILFIDNDSIYVSARYSLTRPNATILIRREIEKLAISKSELLGVAFSPTVAQIKKASNRMSWIVGIFTVISVFGIIIGVR